MHDNYEVLYEDTRISMWKELTPGGDEGIAICDLESGDTVVINAGAMFFVMNALQAYMIERVKQSLAAKLDTPGDE